MPAFSGARTRGFVAFLGADSDEFEDEFSNIRSVTLDLAVAVGLSCSLRRPGRRLKKQIRAGSFFFFFGLRTFSLHGVPDTILLGRDVFSSVGSVGAVPEDVLVARDDFTAVPEDIFAAEVDLEDDDIDFVVEENTGREGEDSGGSTTDMTE